MKPDKFPDWATEEQIDPVSGQNNVVEPPDIRKQSGWTRREIPPRQWFNWLAKKTAEWLRWFEPRADKVDAATPGSTPNTLILRDGNGRASIVTPQATAEIANKGYVDAVADNFDDHVADTDPHSATPEATPNRIILRDASGRAQVAAPSAEDDIARKADVDAVSSQLLQIFESAEQSAFNENTILTVAHGLGARPRFVFARLRCVIAELGYNVGDETDGNFRDNSDGDTASLPARADAENIYYAYGDARPAVVRQIAGKTADWEFITPANWRLVFRAIL